jgi:translation initiation factor IF-3
LLCLVIEEKGKRLRVNKEIRAPKVRVISQTGEQIGVLALYEALARAEQEGLDLVEISPAASPPVCKIINYGKFRYDQTKREKESKKSQHQVKIKEIKIKPNIDDHDLHTKARHAREFIVKGNKVKVTCVFRGREMAHPEIGHKLVDKFCDDLADVATAESPAKMFGKMLMVVLAPGARKKEAKQQAQGQEPKQEKGE